MEEEIKIEGNIDINQALKEFEAKSKIEQQQKQSFESQKNPKDPKDSKMVQLVIKLSGGLIKEERQAEYVLLGFVVLAISVSLFLVFNSRGNKAKLETPPGYKIIYPENEPPRLEKIS